MKTTKFIAIDGHGGSGKSTLANLLAVKFDAEIIHTDDFAGLENPTHWWPFVISNVFETIKNGANKLNYPRSKWWESHNPDPVIDQPVTHIMILEGVTALRNEFRPYLDFGIFVDTPREICLQRGFERDKGQDKKSDNEIKQLWRDWYANEETYINHDKPQHYADLIVNGNKSYDLVLEEIVNKIKSI